MVTIIVTIVVIIVVTIVVTTMVTTMVIHFFSKNIFFRWIFMVLNNIWFISHPIVIRHDKKAYDLKMFPALCVEHSKICRDFSKKLAICIFGCPKLYLGWKKLMKFFFDFHRGDPYVFPQISSKISRWFLKEFLKKNPKGPPYSIHIW